MVLPDIIVYCARHSAVSSWMALFIQGACKAVRTDDGIFVKNNVKQVLVLHRIENGGTVTLVHNEDIEEGVVRILTKLAAYSPIVFPSTSGQAGDVVTITPSQLPALRK